MLLGGIVLILLSASPAMCETIYRWENGFGETFFSNVSPPAEGRVYQTITMAENEGCRISSATGVPAGLNPLLETQAITDCPPKDGSPVSLHLLKERITNRKNEISAMEQLLKKQTSDKGLRRSLMRKKRYLAEELIYLAELNP